MDSRIRLSSAVFIALLITLISSGVFPSPALADEQDEADSNNPGLYGIASHVWWLDPEVHGDELFEALDDLEVTTVRIGIDWKRFEREQGEYDWSKYDRVLGELAERNIEIIANFNTIPAWASANEAGCAIEEREIFDCELRDDMYPEFEEAVRAAVSRYAWIENWEFWNEPEMWTHFGDLTYLDLLHTFYDIARDVNPEVQVAVSTLAGYEFIEWLYNVSENRYGEGNQPWDAVAFHPYNLDDIDSIGDGKPDALRYDQIFELRDLMVEYGNPDMNIWVTEYGWLGDPQEQADKLTEALDWMRRQPFIEFAHLHMLHDWHPTDPGEHYGLMSIVPDDDGSTELQPGTQFEPKPYFYDAFRDFPREGTVPAPDLDSGRFFPATGHVVSGRFLDYWDTMGGYRTIGLPLTRPYSKLQSDGSWLLVQDFERVRMEYHPELQGTEYEVLGTLIGREIIAERGGEEPFLPPSDCESDESRDCFDQTGHSVAYGFRDFWHEHGGLARFGYPISEEFPEENPDTGQIHTVQYFERARFEYHPDLAGTPFEVQLGLLIRDDVQSQGWIPPESPRDPTWRQYE
jgi:hypothetical protein